MTHLRLLALLLALLAVLPASFGTAFAHPLGNFTINRYSRIDLAPGWLQLRYVVDMAEIPAIQELTRIDADANGAHTDQEKAAYLARQTDRLIRGLALTLDGVPVSLRETSSQILLQPGQGGLQTLRIDLALVGDYAVPGGRPLALHYRDDNFVPRMGWGEIVLRAGEGVEIADSTASSEDLSEELRSYPDSLVAAPPEHREAQATFLVKATTGAPIPQLGVRASVPAGPVPFLPPYSLNLQGSLTLGERALALLLALVWGAAHALSPGHGKTIAGAYLVGAQATARHALYLGLAVTATHTLGVYALGLVTLFATRFLLPETLYPWLSLASGLAVAAVGTTLAVGRIRALAASADRGHQQAEHDHPHHHGHEHHPSHLPHNHGHGSHHSHSHRPPGTGGERVTWRSLLALGVAGGLLPCPSALVLMLGAITLGQVAFGLALVAAFSLGLAGVLTAAGIALLYLSRLVPARRYLGPRGTERLLRLAPAVSALVILTLGVAMAAQALGQMGLR